jgi:hypothetical protein
MEHDTPIILIRRTTRKTRSSPTHDRIARNATWFDSVSTAFKGDERKKGRKKGRKKLFSGGLLSRDARIALC